MRARNLKPGFFVNEQLAECSFAARILFEGLWCIADREGRLEDRPRKIKALVFPYDDVDAEPLLCELAAVDLIVRYEVDGSRYIEIPTFTKHQKIHSNEVASTIPPSGTEGAMSYNQLSTKVTSTCRQGEKRLPPNEEVLVTKEESTCHQGEKHFPLNAEVLNDECLNAEATATASGGSGGDLRKTSAHRAKEPEKTVLSQEEREIAGLFKAVPGLKFSPERLAEQVRTLHAEYPNADILAEAKKMALWQEGRTPSQRQKANLLLFVRNWIERSCKTQAQEQAHARDRPVKNPDGSYGTPDPDNRRRMEELAARYAHIT